MVRPIAGAGAGNYSAQPAPHKEPPKKHPIQISEELHSLVTQMAIDRNQSLEQIVTFAVIKQAIVTPLPDGERQILYRQLIHEAEDEIKLRYHTERSRRSLQMRRINAERRKKSGSPAAPHSSASPIRRPINNQYGYPVEYRYGFAIPKPPPSSYPTYYPS